MGGMAIVNHKRASSWQPSYRPRPVFPRDIPPELARQVISYARVIVRMTPERAEIERRAMEATVTEWRDGQKQ